MKFGLDADKLPRIQETIDEIISSPVEDRAKGYPLVQIMW